MNQPQTENTTVLQSDLRQPEKGESSFNSSIDLETLAAQQGVTPVTDTATLLGDFWPENENADDFVNTVRAWRREGNSQERM